MCMHTCILTHIPTLTCKRWLNSHQVWCGDGRNNVEKRPRLPGISFNIHKIWVWVDYGKVRYLCTEGNITVKAESKNWTVQALALITNLMLNSSKDHCDCQGSFSFCLQYQIAPCILRFLLSLGAEWITIRNFASIKKLKGSSMIKESSKLCNNLGVHCISSPSILTSPGLLRCFGLQHATINTVCIFISVSCKFKRNFGIMQNLNATLEQVLVIFLRLPPWHFHAHTHACSSPGTLL